MQRNYFHPIIGLLLVGFLSVTACDKSPQTTLPPIPDAAEYHAWKMTTDLLNYAVPGHLDNCRVVYINAIGEQVHILDEQARRTYEYPEGTVIIKEIYNGFDPPEPGEEPTALTLMIKAPHHPQARHGWLWVQRTFHPQKDTIITQALCVDCHANANEPHPYGDQNVNNEDRDFVYFPPQ